MTQLKKTKIVCTIGPKTESEEALVKLLNAGMNVVRLNFSHGDWQEQGNRVKNYLKASDKTGIKAAILQDLGGPKIRIGKFKTDTITLEKDSGFTITTDDVEGDEHRVSVNYPNFAKEIGVGNKVYLHDVLEKLEVVDVKGNDVVCKVLVGGEIKSLQGVNLPDAELSISSLTEKDKEDVKFGIENKVDFIALSFVRYPKDILELREILNEAKSEAKIIAKIETPQAIKNIDEIIKISDGVMVARGDLAIETLLEEVPAFQKMIIKKCNDAGKPVITATQMLESMLKSPTPTRAEVSDVANAIIDGTDALMLSEETAVGDYPIEAVEEMVRIAVNVENEIISCELVQNKPCLEDSKLSDGSVGASVVKKALEVEAKHIVCLAKSIDIVHSISQFRPCQFIFVFTPNEFVFGQSFLSFGTYPAMIYKFENIEEFKKNVKDFLIEGKFANSGDKIVIVSDSEFVGGENIMVETV